MGGKRTLWRSLGVLAAALIGVVGMASPASAGDARSALVILHNQSDRELIGISADLAHGCWETRPPSRIAPGATVTWKTVSCGVLTGTEGEVVYRVDGEAETERTRVHWDVPWSGDNSFDGQAPQYYRIGHGGSEENNANAITTFTFDCGSRTCDGIPDDWKLNGVSLPTGNGSGQQFVDLPKMGVDVQKPDVFVQLDWMADATHSEKIDPAAIKKVVEAFANSSHPNRTGTRGVNLHIDQGPDSIIDFGSNRTWGSLSRAKARPWSEHLGASTDGKYDWAAFDAIKKAPDGFVPTGRQPLFHYALAAHKLAPVADDGTAGRTRSIPGSDYVLGLTGLFTNGATVDEQAMVLMHELGHNLGLGHGGFEDREHKPNYLSIMNPSFYEGLTRDGRSWVHDFSRAKIDLDERSLDERVGLGPAAGTNGTAHWCPAIQKYVTIAKANGPIDWNCDGVIASTPVAADTNGDNENTALGGFDDWASLKLRGGAIGHVSANFEQFTEGVEPPFVDDRLLPLDTTAPVTTAVTDPPANGDGYHRTDVAVSLNATDDISGAVRTEFDLDGAGWTGYGGPVLVTSPGAHTVAYRSVDRAQNVEAVRSLTVWIDKQAPVSTGTLDPTPNAAGWLKSSGTLTVHAVDEPGGSGVASVTYSATGAQPVAPTTVAGDSARLVVDREGETVVTYYATDKAGNAELTHTVTVRVDKTATVSAFTTPAEAIFVAVAVGGPGPEQYVEGTAVDPTSGVDKVLVTYTPVLLGSPTTAAAQVTCTDAARHNCTWRLAPPSGVGRYRVSVSAVDPAGNVEQAGTPIHVTVVRLVP